MLNKTQTRAQSKANRMDEGVLVFVSVGISDGGGSRSDNKRSRGYALRY
jgi:hypothetical protein